MATSAARPPRLRHRAARVRAPPAPFVASLIGRLPMGAIGLVFILRTHEITGSFAAGGVATAAYALSLGAGRARPGPADRPQGPDARAARRGALHAAALIGFAALPGRRRRCR